MKKQSYHHGDLPNSLVAAAVELIAEKGLDALTLREVAGMVGVTHSAAYRHFADKTGLLAAVSEDGYRALAARLADVDAGERGAPIPRVRALACAYVAFALERPEHYSVMHGMRLNEDGQFPALEAAIAESLSFLFGAIEDGQRAGAIRPAPAARELAFGTLIAAHGFVELVARRRLKVRSTPIAVGYFATLFEPYLDGLTAPRSDERA